MRVTNSMLSNNLLRNLNTNLSRLEKYQTQLATGKKIQYASDDPIIASRALRLRTDLSEFEQYTKNINDGASWLDTTEVALKNVGDALQKIRELTVSAANGTKTPSDKAKIAAEVEQLKEQLIGIGNTTYAGRYIFSGYNTDKKLFDENGNYNIDVTDSMVKDRPLIKYEVGVGENVQISTHGLDVFKYEELNGAGFIGTGESTGTPPTKAKVGPGNNFTLANISNGDFDNLKIIVTCNNDRKEIQLGSGIKNMVDLKNELNKINTAFTPAGKVTANVSATSPYNIEIETDGLAEDTLKVDVVKAKESTLMKDIDDLVAAMKAGDDKVISGFLDKIDGHMQTVLAQRAEVGARSNRVELLKARIGEDTVNFTKLLSQNEDVDTAEAIIKMKSEENVYRASLSMGAKVIQPTLLDFIR